MYYKCHVIVLVFFLIVTRDSLTKLAQGYDAPFLSLEFLDRSSRIGEVFFLARNVEEVEGVDGVRHK